MQIYQNNIWFPEQKVLLMFPIQGTLILSEYTPPWKLAQQASYIFRSTGDHYTFQLSKDRFGMRPLQEIDEVFSEYTIENPADAHPIIHVNPEEWTYYRLLCS